MRKPITWRTDEWYGPDEIPEYAGMHLTTRQGEHGTYVQANWFNLETREWTYRPYGMPLADPLIAWTRMPIPCPLERGHLATKKPTITQLDIDDVNHETASKPR